MDIQNVKYITTDTPGYRVGDKFKRLCALLIDRIEEDYPTHLKMRILLDSTGYNSMHNAYGVRFTVIDNRRRVSRKPQHIDRLHFIVEKLIEYLKNTIPYNIYEVYKFINSPNYYLHFKIDNKPIERHISKEFIERCHQLLNVKAPVSNVRLLTEQELLELQQNEHMLQTAYQSERQKMLMSSLDDIEDSARYENDYPV